ncbi:MAG: anthranilate phosphoribosyltransferase [Thermoleophilaceae bacterium]|nr:anthranilate phosphoribosyltransferase [Thermoleophilaceae bacterium]
MPSSSDSELLADLVSQKYPIAEEAWGDFWDRLRARELRDGEALAVAVSLSTRTPDGASISSMLKSLRARNPQPDPPSRTTVNIVGTGGGPSTFNLSTASAFVAAALGARVIKTGSRAYASKTGSIDLLDRLGITLTKSYEQTDEMLETYGMACCGAFVYPKELRLLARSILPFGMKQMGRFFNVVGPFLGAVPVSTQITGVSDHSVLPTFRQLVREDETKSYWICSNELGADELLSIVDSQVYDSGKDEEFVLSPTEIGLSGGSFDELRPVSDIDATVDHFLGLISGDGPTAAIESIKLNAAALAINCGVADGWPQGLEMAAEAMANREPAALIERLRAHGQQSASAPASKAQAQ